MQDDEALVTRVKLRGVEPAIQDAAAQYIQPDIRPNSRINLFIYNFANSKKGVYRTDKVRNVGEPPRILDSSLVELSRLQIERFLRSKGFFYASVMDSIIIRRQRAHIYFFADPGPVFHIRRWAQQIDDREVSVLYQQWRQEHSYVTPGMRYDADLLGAEREYIFHKMKQHGRFDFLRQYVSFEVDTGLQGALADVVMRIEAPRGGTVHPEYTIDSSFVVIGGANGTVGRRTHPSEIMALPGGIYVTDLSGRFKPRPVTRYLFQKQGDRYNAIMENLTYDRLYELNAFRNIRIAYEKADSARLNVHYELMPLKKMANRMEGEYTFNTGRSGFNIGNTFTNRNLFGGAERFDLKLKYGVLFDAWSDNQWFGPIFNRDIQLGATLTLPRLMVPFRVPLMGKSGMPYTTLSLNWQIFDQVNTYSNRYVIGSVAYNWYETRYKLHTITPLIAEFRLGKLAPSFYDELTEKGFLLYIRSNDRAYFGLGSQYAYTHNALRLNRLENFSYFRGTIDLSGNTLSLLSNVFNFDRNNVDERMVFGVPYLQYARMETDFRWYRHLGGDKQLVFRLNPGIVIPYGNNRDFVIFEKSFFGGGMNGIRAWQARTLGPGNYNREILDESLRLGLRNLDQLGEIKIESNLEYRFRLFRDFLGAKLKGAAFADSGNIWRFREVENPGGEFNWNTFLGQMAIGAGAGLRFDLDYFVFRLDAGLKVRDPQFTGAKQWVIRELFHSREFKRQYAITNGPDRYNFIQYNFGIGMPF